MGRKRRWTAITSVVLAAVLTLGLAPSLVYGDTEGVSDQDKAAEWQLQPELESVAEDTGQEPIEGAVEVETETLTQSSDEEQSIQETNENQTTESDSSSEEEPVFVGSALNEPTAGIMPLGVWGSPPSSIVARVTLYPPPYGRSVTNPSNFGYFGNEWYYIRNNGFTPAYNTVEIISGYAGNDWLYGAYGTAENNAAFSSNNTVICIDAGDTPPSPGGNNTRDITMNYIRETTYNGQQYYLYWGAVAFNFEVTYSYGNGPQRMGTFVALPKEFGDPVRMVAQKLDSITGEPFGQDDPNGGRLAGAQFTIRFWENLYFDTVEQAEANGAPTKKWVVETAANGRATLSDLLPGSDLLYTDNYGDPYLPLGTIVIHETKAPDGYLLPNPNTSTIQQIRYDSYLNQVIAYNPIIVMEQPRIVEVEKYDAVAGVPLLGAEYMLMRESALGTGDWMQLYGTKTTGADGKVNWSPVPSGSYKIVEVTPPTGYQLPSEGGDIDYQAFVIDADDPTQLTTVVFRNYAKPDIDVLKIDADTLNPIEDTEFTLYFYSSVNVENGYVTSNIAQIGSDNPAWVQLGSAATDADGKLVFSGLPYGYYMIRETRPNVDYASYEETGGLPRFIKIDRTYTGELQVFEDELIRIGVEVYKKTIRVTSSALDGTEHDAVNNVGQEEYHYNLGARSTSAVYVDEFIITDDLTMVTSLGYRMTTLWTGTSPAGLDFDDKVTVLYRTNMTSINEVPVFTYDVMAANPHNPNNPNNQMLYSQVGGWRIWAEALSTTSATRLDVSSLGLADGEYIIGLMFVYGGVQPGFFVGSGYSRYVEANTLRSGTQVNDHSLASSYYDWMYAVVATEALTPVDEAGMETIMRGSVTADVSRNTVLTDSDYDEVQTRVIEPFSYALRFRGYVSQGGGTKYPSLPKTGDTLVSPTMAFVLAIAGTVSLYAGRRKRKEVVANMP